MTSASLDNRIVEIAEQAAPFITGAWRFNRLASEKRSSEWRTIAVISDDEQPGRTIDLRPDWNKSGRIAISGSMPDNSYYQGHITVSDQRSGKAIAGDINRRLLPDYLRCWSKRHADHVERARKAVEFEQKRYLLSQILPGFRDGYAHGSEERFYFEAGNDGLRGKVQMYKYYSEDTATLEVRLTFDQLVKLAAFISGEL